MLPGFRFLFAAIVLSMSLLIFGLGAAALLRAAHQEFASLPSRRAPPEPVFASQNDATIPALAMLRIDTPPAPDQETLERPAIDSVQAAAMPQDLPIVATATAQLPAAEPESVASVTPEPELQNVTEVPPSETPALDASAAISDTPPAAELPQAAEARRLAEAPQAAEPPSSIDTTVAATETAAPPSANQPAPADPAPISAVAPTTDAVETKVATLGDPTVEIQPQASPIKAKAKSRANAARKRLQAERASKRRKMAQRARASRRASQAADPFGAQPFGGFPRAQ